MGHPAGQLSGVPHTRNAATFGLLPKITCPHCWHRFSPGEILWVAEHQEFVGDPVAGADAYRRFLPSRFTPDGQAVDGQGQICQLLACPQCHLNIPRPILKADPYFFSIIGGPSSGKTWLLASMIWQLRRTLPSHFNLTFNDADPLSNIMLNENESRLFLAEDPDAVINLMKTEEKGGGFYDEVALAGQPVQLPKPFLFKMASAAGHRLYNTERSSRILCLYDNAGESFQPGHDHGLSPTTRHLGKSRALLFLFDPTQDPRFREQCRQFSSDPQLSAKAKYQAHGGQSALSQHTLLLEAAQRIRRYAGLPANVKYERPLLMVISKSDVWGKLIEEDLISEPIVNPSAQGQGLMDVPRIDRVSGKIRELLLKWTPEIVSAAEDFCKWVVYIPVSALGSAPEPVPDSPGFFGARPRNIKPKWVTIPLLYMFGKWGTDLIPISVSSELRKTPTSSNGSGPSAQTPHRQSSEGKRP
jgi:hypothetical protein